MTVTLDARAICIAMHTAAHCGDCGCAKEDGGPGYCKVLQMNALSHLRAATFSENRHLREAIELAQGALNEVHRENKTP